MININLLHAISFPKNHTRFDLRVGKVRVAATYDHFSGSIFVWLISHEFTAPREEADAIRDAATRHIQYLMRCASRETRINLTRQLDAQGNQIEVLGSTRFCGNYAYKPGVGWYRWTSLTQAMMNHDNLFGRMDKIKRFAFAK